MKVLYCFYNQEGDPQVGRPEHTMTIVYRNDLGIDRCMVLSLEKLVNALGKNISETEGVIWDGDKKN